MTATIDARGDSRIAILQNEEVVLSSWQDALDMMGTCVYEHDCRKAIIDKNMCAPEIFDLSTRIMGDILQKLTNYGMRLAIVGDTWQDKSKSFSDFVYECNQGNSFFFVTSREEALLRLHGSH